MPQSRGGYEYEVVEVGGWDLALSASKMAAWHRATLAHSMWGCLQNNPGQNDVSAEGRVHHLEAGPTRGAFLGYLQKVASAVVHGQQGIYPRTIFCRG